GCARLFARRRGHRGCRESTCRGRDSARRDERPSRESALRVAHAEVPSTAAQAELDADGAMVRTNANAAEAEVLLRAGVVVLVEQVLGERHETPTIAVDTGAQVEHIERRHAER